MHPAIARLPNALFYQGAIRDGVSPEDRTAALQPFAHHPLLFINCPHAEQEGAEETGAGSKRTYCNPYEALIIRAYLAHFPREELGRVGIITPYVDQLRLLQREFAGEAREGLTVRTCDGFQGGERDYIFISLVRSNPEGNIGFTGEESRVNVSITRARRGLMIVGNAPTFAASLNHWGAIAQYAHSQGAYFEFDAPISQEQVNALLAKKDLPAGKQGGEVEGVRGFPSFEEYRQ